jgi:hypothetical protein
MCMNVKILLVFITLSLARLSGRLWRVKVMKRLVLCTFVLTLLCASVPCAQGFSGLAMPQFGTLLENVKVIPTVQAGFQHVGSNMSLPINFESSGAGLLQIETLDIALSDANFWTGSASVMVKSGELFSLFGTVGGSLNRPFIVSGQIPVSLGAVAAQPTIDFTGEQMSAWYAQGGVALGPILLGVYGDHFGVEVADPRLRAGGAPLANQTLRGDVISTTLAPFIGVGIPFYNGLLTAIYSPFAQSNTTVALRTSDRDVAQAQYKWNKPGQLFSCNFQYNLQPVQSFTFGMWANYAWMDIRGDAKLDFQDATVGLSRQKDVTATMTKFVIQGGFTGSLAF